MKVSGALAIFILFAIYFNPSNIYALLYGALAYGTSFFRKNLGNRVGVIVELFILIRFYFCEIIISRVHYNCAVCGFLFLIWLFLSTSSYLLLLLVSKSEMKGVFNIMSRPRTSWTGAACNVVWYVLCTAKSLAARILNQGTSLSCTVWARSPESTKYGLKCYN